MVARSKHAILWTASDLCLRKSRPLEPWNHCSLVGQCAFCCLAIVDDAKESSRCACALRKMSTKPSHNAHRPFPPHREIHSHSHLTLQVATTRALTYHQESSPAAKHLSGSNFLLNDWGLSTGVDHTHEIHPSRNTQRSSGEDCSLQYSTSQTHGSQYTTLSRRINARGQRPIRDR